MQGRGLKLQKVQRQAGDRMSPLMQGRGLKHEIKLMIAQTKGVAPHAGAWIETGQATPPLTTGRVAPHAGAWIETFL